MIRKYLRFATLGNATFAVIGGLVVASACVGWETCCAPRVFFIVHNASENPITRVTVAFRGDVWRFGPLAPKESRSHVAGGVDGEGGYDVVIDRGTCKDAFHRETYWSIADSGSVEITVGQPGQATVVSRIGRRFFGELDRFEWPNLEWRQRCAM